jgi:hypothetical protein
MFDRLAKRGRHAQFLERELGEIVEGLDLEPLQKRFVRSRWLAQLVWFEKKAAYNQRLYYALRLLTIAGAVTTAAIVSLNVRASATDAALGWTAFGISLSVALSAALEGFFHYGERWRAFRRTSEALKAHGWQFFEIAGAYAGATTHREAFPTFAREVEALAQQDVEQFISVATAPRDEPSPRDPGVAPRG